MSYMLIALSRMAENLTYLCRHQHNNHTQLLWFWSKMNEIDLILFFVLTTTTLAASYIFLERIRCLQLWDDYKSTILNPYRCKRVVQEQPSYFSILSFANWKYRGEGNEYLAISLPEKRQILRLRKSPCPIGLLANGLDWICRNYGANTAVESTAMRFERLNLEYYKVLLGLLGRCFVQPAEDVQIHQTEVEKINTIVSSHRPAYRKKKRIGYACGSLLTDYAYLPVEWDAQFTGPTFAVEIKPKQGWIAPNDRIYPLCTYCHNQYIKLQNGETSNISGYCPMDLFSGNQTRMKYAVKCLLDSPQNNIKIFEDGVLVYGEGSTKEVETVLAGLFKTSADQTFVNLDEFSALVTTALVADLHKVNTTHNCQHTKMSSNNKNSICDTNLPTKKCNLHRESLPSGCVLQRILNLQQLDVWGANAVASIEKSMNHTENKYAHALAVVQRALNLEQRADCARCFFTNHINNNTILCAADQSELVVQQYLMAAIAKDCSLMLTFRKVTGTQDKIPQNNVVHTGNASYAFRVGVFDLYPKPATCISKHVRKRQRFRETYNCILNENYNKQKS